jgi:Pentapeptide repeats (8 copies)
LETRNPSIRPILTGAVLCDLDLAGANFDGADVDCADLSGSRVAGATFVETNLYRSDLSDADFSDANFLRADLGETKLIQAKLCRAYLGGTNLGEADLSGADLSGANLRGANFFRANLSKANLIGTDLMGAQLVEAKLIDANLSASRIYGVSAWKVQVNDGTTQRELIVTDETESKVTTDDLEMAQFLYLMLHNEKLRGVIDTITSKVVLVLGRFSAGRKVILDAIREELRNRPYVPVVFDFEQPSNRTTDETVTLLARMARFIIADISDAKSVLEELRGIVPDCPTIPVQPIIVSDQEEPGMFDFFRRYPWVLNVVRYVDQAELLAHLDDRVITPAEVAVGNIRAAL